MSTDNFLPDDDTFTALAGLPDDHPVVMLNLLEFTDDGGESFRANVDTIETDMCLDSTRVPEQG